MHPPVSHETRHAPGDDLHTHRHVSAYAALVVEGGYAETSADGLIECAPGTLLLHPRYHAHGNRIGHNGARVINLELSANEASMTMRVLHVPDAAEAMSVFLRAPQHLDALIAISNAAPIARLHQWQSAFLDELLESDAPIEHIARHAGVSVEHASRTFRRSHGMSPQSLRRELRCRRALTLLAGSDSLAEVAINSGFADQSHLTRSVRAMTGLPPARLRREINCVQDRSAAV
jgi:AraC-like DNA-binding protein